MAHNPFDYANLANIAFIESLYEQYTQNPESVDPSWQRFFEGMRFASSLPTHGIESSVRQKDPSCSPVQEAPSDERILWAYRTFGHLAAKTSMFVEAKGVPELEVHSANAEASGTSTALIKQLARAYTGTVGYEFMHLEDPEIRDFIANEVEKNAETAFSKEEKLAFFAQLTKAEMFESFIHKKYQGQKRFSLEGGEPFIPMLLELVDYGAEEGVDEAIVAMAHRGRLNTLANVFDKPYKDMFFEFEPNYRPPFHHVSGDVKYHLGYVAERTTLYGKPVRMELMPNPSHLESVNGPAEGYARASQDAKGRERKKVLPLLIHGDSAVAGQGIVYEVLQMYKLDAYETGGTIHVIINNHVGFTAGAEESRSTRYCSDIAKSFGAPVFHVNADDTEGCVFAARIAAKLRQRYGCEVFIELNCYRRYGHNEGDEPMFTNPLMYKALKERETPQQMYRKKLVNDGVASEAELNQIEESFRNTLEEALTAAKKQSETFQESIPEEKSVEKEAVKTAVSKEQLLVYAEKMTSLPDSLKVHPKIQRIISERRKMVEEGQGIDWGCAEHLAFASILAEGKNIRISGQDSRRGTFAHRHAAIIDQDSKEAYFPLQHISEDQGVFEIYNSFLSEEAVLGFEFGYNTFNPSHLTIWEAQYGDFANGAQVVFDQYIASSEQKWNQVSSLVLMLPHGYEGGGPEHSSARIERYLQLAANDNIRVVIPSTPSQVFHALRRQVLSNEKKPLILFTPKALLRFQPSLSPLHSLCDEEFRTIIKDPRNIESPQRIIFCSGKVYYELLPHSEKLSNTAIVRIEQLYPFDGDAVRTVFEEYGSPQEVIWLQEEHQNMGCFEFIQPLLRTTLSDTVKLTYVGRKRSASTAAGSMALHNKELETLLQEAFE